MPRTVDYVCENKHREPAKDDEGKPLEEEVKLYPCGYEDEELFNDTEEQPDVLPGKACPRCGGKLVKGLNLKNNSQVWGVNKI